MSYSLISRDIMAAMIEIHALGHPHDAMVLISGNDKSVPAHLLAIARARRAPALRQKIRVRHSACSGCDRCLNRLDTGKRFYAWSSFGLGAVRGFVWDDVMEYAETMTNTPLAAEHP